MWCFFDKFVHNEEAFAHHGTAENWNATVQAHRLGSFLATAEWARGISINRCLGAVYYVDYVPWGASGKEHDELRTADHYH
ncbi:hypothetical protein GCM10027341_13390 [Spirosoma knui]